MLCDAAVPPGFGGFFERLDGAEYMMGTNRPMHPMETNRARSELGSRQIGTTLTSPVFARV